jgi:hypothetical protein
LLEKGKKMNQENQDFIPENGDNQPQGSSGNGQSELKDKLLEGVEKFKELPPKFQFGILGGVAFVLYIVFSGGGAPSQPPTQPQAAVKQATEATGTTTARSINQEDDSSFSTLDPESGVLRQAYFENQSRVITKKLTEVTEEVNAKMDELQEMQEALQRQGKDLQTKVDNFSDRMKTMGRGNKDSQEEIRRLIEESQNKDINIPGGSNNNGASFPGGGPQAPKSGRKLPLKQILLKSDASGMGNIGNPLLGGLLNPGSPEQAMLDQIENDTEVAAPFIPPLGFIRGTLINGFDALAGSGTPSPALIRLSGTYKTAMNSTVNLNGCFMLAEFEGDLSTERAFGTPARMTCVYPDQGAVTYDVAGYVVDEKDGIVGIPGIFYEGDPSRLAAAMVADFTAAIAEIVKTNQSTATTTADGVEQSTLTGSETKSEIAGGVSTAVGSLKDYLEERATRIVPFVRVDATRELHIVILEGVELRHEGKPWTLLVSGESKDALKTKKEQKLQQLRAAQQNQRGR